MKRSSTKFVQIMPLGFSIIGSTVTFDLFLRWATQGPLGPLVTFAELFQEVENLKVALDFLRLVQNAMLRQGKYVLFITNIKLGV